MKLGVIDVGGGFRDIYGAGVFDWCLDHDVNFDYCIGISAGSANLASYLARQRGRNYTFYMDYVFRKEYASLDNWLKTRNYVDLDYVYSTLSNSDGENPIDYETLAKNPAEFYVGACDARTGQAVYFSKSCLKKDHYDIFKGSCALPMFCKPYRVENIPCLDGGISDPVPVLKAFEDGCDKVVLILTRPIEQKREQKKDVVPARLLAKTIRRRPNGCSTATACITTAWRLPKSIRSSVSCSSSRRMISAVCLRSARAMKSCK